MAEEYSNHELNDMHLVYGKCDCNAMAAARQYAIKYPNRRHPDRGVFERINRSLCDTGTFKQRREGLGAASSTARRDERVLQEIENSPNLSTRSAARRLGVSRMTVWRTLHTDHQHPYHHTPVQTLFEEDKIHRRSFCEVMLLRHRENREFLSSILWTDEAQFTRDGVTNFHNLHTWSHENPHEKRQVKSQHRFSINVWMGVIGQALVGPYIIPGNMTGGVYLDFLQNHLPNMLDDEVPLNLRNRLFFQQDGAPPHFRRDVRNYLDDNYPERWIGRGGPVGWPARSPDLTPLDFYIWGHMKGLVYAVEILSREQLQQRIMNAADEIRQNLPSVNLKQEIIKRLTMCMQNNGDHIENLL